VQFLEHQRSSVTLILTLDWVEVILVCISGRGLPKTILDQNRKKTDLRSNLLDHRWAMTSIEKPPYLSSGSNKSAL